MNHMRPPSLLSFFLITVSVIVCHLNCEAGDSINVRNPLSDSGDSLVSAGNRFELGFFTPEGNEKGSRYVGIWYYELKPRTIVWVANRDNPLPDSCGVFGIAEDGNLKVWCSKEVVVSVTSHENPTTFNRTLQLLDTGNLILVDGQSSTRLWESFNCPADTFLPGMKMNDSLELTSWISPSDPAKGIYIFRQYEGGYCILNGSAMHWKSGQRGASTISDGLPPSLNRIFSDSNTGLDEKNQPLGKRGRPTSLLNYTIKEYDSRLVMNYSGKIEYFEKLNDGGNWSLSWSQPKSPCSAYEVCGKFAVCYIKEHLMCQCPPGFKPVSSDDSSEGCHREPKCSQNDKFLNLSLMEILGQVIPFDPAQKEEACKEQCLTDCKCNAYSYVHDKVTDREPGNSSGKCWIWNDLQNLHKGITAGILNLSLRVPESARAMVPLPPGGRPETSKNILQERYVIVFTVLVAGVILVSCSSYILHRRRMAERSGHRGNNEATPVLFSYGSERQINDLMPENAKRIDVPFYNLDDILSATDNFSDANKLGQGGFGPVYKGTFPGGHEIAVKRLSSCSGQGIEEFLNEVVLIAKLQHRNLVRLLGYCIKGNEKILLYEYMPNRSLDAYIFDQHKRLLLDWEKRFDIILGIARGLLYLHQDSRLRIIHRDLKTSNILLDEEMNPKISDFGLARIVEGKRTEASTNKVVGTYGYMSPEYAMDGKFSIKSDVFSFGVVMLEIVSGKKNTGFYNPHEVLNLLGYAWRLWCDNKAIDLVDPTLFESCEKSQVIKCINIGLLCVQEDPNNRPSMSTVILMLGSETTPLPLPSQPAFVVRRRLSSTASSSSSKPDMISNNELTISLAQGR